MKQRNAATLVEVLIAIFVGALGMISLLALIPLGLRNMAESVKDYRLATAAANAEAMAELFDVRKGPAVLAAASRGAPRPDVVPDVFPSVPGGDSRWNQIFQAVGSAVAFVDPIGCSEFNETTLPIASGYDPNGTNEGVFAHVGGMRNTATPARWSYVQLSDPPTYPYPTTLFRSYGVPRTPGPFGTADVNRCVLEDDIRFTSYGVAATDSLVVERDRRYSWAYVWRVPNVNQPKIVDLSIVLFSGRRLGATSSSLTTLAVNERILRGTLRPLTNTLPHTRRPVFGFDANRPTVARVTWDPNDADQIGDPDLRPGTWLFDATVTDNAPLPQPTDDTGEIVRGSAIVGGQFYKIIALGNKVRVGTEWQQEVTLDRPALNRGFVAVLFSNVVDVVEKSYGR